MSYRNFIKPILDFIFSGILFLVLSPVFLLITIVGLFAFKGKPFFFQPRAGYKERQFYVLKFKTMRDAFDGFGNPLPDHKRLTPFGKFLRKTSLDELPQLLNVLKGEMSLVGPRPLLVNYLPWYTETEKQRHLVKPGITGYAQIHGRNLLSWDQRLHDDVIYTQKISFSLDVSILFKTISNLFFANDFATDPRSSLNDFDEVRSRLSQYRVNDQFILRKPVWNDAAQLLAVKNNLEAAALLEQENSGYTITGIRNWITYHATQPGNLMYVIEHISMHEIIGHAGFYNMQHDKGSCVYGILIGLPTYWNRGIGMAVTNKMLDIAFGELKIQTVFLNVLKKNERAVHLYNKIGFHLTGEKTILRNNQQEVVYTMSIDKDEVHIS